MEEKIEVGFQAFVSDGIEEFGAVRVVSPQGAPELVIYLENAGDFAVPLAAVESVHSRKVIFKLRQAGSSPPSGYWPRPRCGEARILTRVKSKEPKTNERNQR